MKSGSPKSLIFKIIARVQTFMDVWSVQWKSKTLLVLCLWRCPKFYSQKSFAYTGDCFRIKYSGNPAKRGSRSDHRWLKTNLVVGSRNDGNLVNVNSNRDGNLNVNWNLNADNHNPNLGGRSSGVSCKYVIASEQSECGNLDCFVASLLAMTNYFRKRFQPPIMRPISWRLFSSCRYFLLSNALLSLA